MPILETEITINALPQTVWSVLDDLEHYPEWNSLVPDLKGITTVGRVVTGTLIQPNTPDIPLSPTVTRIIAGRELRWVTEAPEPGIFRAEHIFILEPLPEGRTHLIHNESFDGAAVAEVWDGINVNGRKAYNDMNVALKAHAEAKARTVVRLHPAAQLSGQTSRASASTKTVLSCRCGQSPVRLELTQPVRHNHLCGCSKCWKAEGALFSQVAVVPGGSSTILSGEDKLTPVDPQQSIVRYACRDCGTHLIGRVPDKNHHFYGCEFVHPELGDTEAPRPEFAAFVSSIIETGASPSEMQAVRSGFAAIGLPAYDAFSPELMDIIAWHRVKMREAAT
ncbi:SRPBCC family protein [Aminobacter sp. MSH1]|uniref:GFA family protein n=1 Tax=Aminobacter sp. MSH1 TaxID=374606 RepID=UPI000D3D3B05|nr:SRPBCC family protein [Aminobacter sp. MSH1]